MSVTYMGPLGGKQAEFGFVTASRARRQWQFFTNSRSDDETTIYNYGVANGLPVPYVTRHPTAPLLLCRVLHIDQVKENPLRWVVTAEYASQEITQQERNAFVPPLSRPARIRWRGNKYSKAVEFDNGGNPIVNSAGDPPEAREVPRSRPLCVISKNVASVPSWIFGYGDAINSTAFTVQGVSVPTERAKIDDWELSELQIESDSNGTEYLYYVFTWAFEICIDQPTYWKFAFVDQGFRQKDPNDATKRIQILDDTVPPQPISSPALLDGTGKKLANPSGSNAVYRTYEIYPLLDFNQLPLS